MKTSLLTTRRVLIATLAIALVGTLAFVSLRTGPLAPIKVTVAQPTEVDRECERERGHRR